MVLENFIVLEGIDGAGTTTQLKMLKARPEAKNFLFTTEPTSYDTGKFLRQVLSGNVEVTPQTAAFLFAADRCEHVYGKLITEGDRNLVTGIEAACRDYRAVVSDRYFFSSLAYQSVGCGMTLPSLLNSTFPLPGLLFYFDIDPEVSLERVSRRGAKEIYEKQDFLIKTRSAYEEILKRYDGTQEGHGMKIVRLDATKSPAEISKIIWKNISKLP